MEAQEQYGDVCTPAVIAVEAAHAHHARRTTQDPRPYRAGVRDMPGQLESPVVVAERLTAASGTSI